MYVYSLCMYVGCSDKQKSFWGLVIMLWGTIKSLNLRVVRHAFCYAIELLIL